LSHHGPKVQTWSRNLRCGAEACGFRIMEHALLGARSEIT
jgi:hypothetical protein